jgi:hypothetical protein
MVVLRSLRVRLILRVTSGRNPDLPQEGYKIQIHTLILGQAITSLNAFGG